MKKTIEEMIVEIASRRMIRIEKWREEGGHWMVGLEWYSKDNYSFIVEKKTLQEALEYTLAYLNFSESTK